MSTLINLCCTPIYSPSDYRPPPNSPHTGIKLPRPQSATPSGVPQYKPQFVFVPRLPNSINYTKERNLSKPIRTSHDLAYSTGLPKPPGYNLEWPSVTPIQVTLVTRPSTKHRIMTSIQSYVKILLAIQLCTQNRLAHLLLC